MAKRKAVNTKKEFHQSVRKFMSKKATLDLLMDLYRTRMSYVIDGAEKIDDPEEAKEHEKSLYALIIMSATVRAILYQRGLILKPRFTFQNFFSDEVRSLN